MKKHPLQLLLYCILLTQTIAASNNYFTEISESKLLEYCDKNKIAKDKCFIICTKWLPKLFAIIQAHASKLGIDTPIILYENDPYPNASALCYTQKNGREYAEITLNRGIFSYPDEVIEAIICHELGHLKALHSKKHLSARLIYKRAQKPFAIFGTTMYVLSSLIGAEAVEIIVRILNEKRIANPPELPLFLIPFLLASNYSVYQSCHQLPARLFYKYKRTHEYEADRIGCYSLALAQGSINRRKTMKKEYPTTDTSESMHTHPSDDNRIKALEKHIVMLITGQNPSGFSGYHTRAQEWLIGKVDQFMLYLYIRKYPKAKDAS